MILDPQGTLFFGSKQVIPFDVTDADIYVDIIALCPVPQLLDFTLITPAGDVINAAGGPNARYAVRPEVAFYRVTLPALAADPGGSHAGKWQAVLSLKSRAEIDKLLEDRDIAAAFRAVGDSLPYSLTAHAYSNLQFEARLQQDSLRPGAIVALNASLKMYDIPFTDDATVWAEATWPDHTTTNLKLDRVVDGLYAASFIASLPGVYPCRVRAQGYFRSKDRFTREKTLIAATYYGNYGTTPPANVLCDLLHCLTSEKVLIKRVVKKLEDLGIDLPALVKCLEEHCPQPSEHIPARPARVQPAAPAGTRPPVNIKALPETRPVDRPAVAPIRAAARTVPRTPRVIHMFTRPEEMTPETSMAHETASQTPMTSFPASSGCSRTPTRLPGKSVRPTIAVEACCALYRHRFPAQARAAACRHRRLWRQAARPLRRG